MSPLQLEGATLGRKHQNFNERVNELLENDTTLDSVGSEFGESVVAQLLKIEVANRRRDMEYLVQTLKSADMVVVSRAIRGGGWLVVDGKYSHIVEPHFLHDQLLPHMTTRAACKFMLHVRLTLRDERRVESFFKYYVDKDLSKALKWLPGCSSDFIVNAVKKHAHKDKITIKLFRKLCEKCPTVFETFLGNFHYFKKHHMQTVMFLLKTNPTKYLDEFEKFEIYESYSKPSFGKKQTKVIMKHNTERILKNFSSYAQNINLRVVAKHMQPENIKQFIINLSNDQDLKFWLTYKNIKPFIHVMPRPGKFEFLKDSFIDKVSKNGSAEGTQLSEALRLGLNPTNRKSIYKWYRHAPFEVAFSDLKEMLKAESSPEERGGIFRVMLTAAGPDLTNVHTVLQFYHDKHINEPFKYKINFLNAIISVTKTHRYDDNTWNILDELFHSCEVYIESNNNIQNSLEAIIVRAIVHQQLVPKIIEKKFIFSSLKKFKKNLTDIERENVFKYLYNLLKTKILEDEKEVNKLVPLLHNMLDLLIDWNKELKQFLFVIDKIEETAKLNKNENLNIDMEIIYNKKKSWRFHMFEESFLLCNKEKVYINALKHDPSIFKRFEAAVAAIQCDDNVNLVHFHSKLRIYWPDTLAEDWAASYRKHIEQLKGHRAVVRGLCALLPRQELLELIDKFAPDSSKIVWSEIDNNLLSLRKCIASQMNRAQPQPPPLYILKYACGDYLQYALSSLCSIYSNLSLPESREYLPLLLKGTVSLQKVGIRVASSKLDPIELREVLIDIWKTSKNAIIRAVIFRSTFKRLTSELNDNNAKILWDLLEVFMDDLSTEENQAVYVLLGNIEEVPICYRSKYCVKAYNILKTVPPKANCDKILHTVIAFSASVMDTIDQDFATDLLLNYIDTWLVNSKCLHRKYLHQHVYFIKNVISNYLICSKSEAEQQLKLDTVIRPWIKHVIPKWDTTIDSELILESYFRQCLHACFMTMSEYFAKKKDCVSPVPAFKLIKEELEAVLPLNRHYDHVLHLRFAMSYALCYDKVKDSFPDLPQDIDCNEIILKTRQKELFQKIAPLFAKNCIQMLKEDKETYFNSIQPIFEHCLSEFVPAVSGYQTIILYDFEKELINNDDIHGPLLAIGVLPPNYYGSENVRLVNEVRSMLLDHPSMEVKLHYNSKYCANPIRSRTAPVYVSQE